MNIYTVAENLRKTIAGKEKYLSECKEALDKGITKTEVHISLFTTHEFLRVNIAELKRILADVETCCEKATEDSWALNPDRMGGAFTDEEINRSSEWR